ncbi:hypothetical protein [Pseudidiomarina aestuarii]|uniref:hypothetical protein n=1 Tax=Pseudidiomarina aestuarii TaxID=624146 RepID=UPI003A976659
MMPFRFGLEVRSNWRLAEFFVFFIVLLFLIYSLMKGFTMSEQHFSGYISDYYCQQDGKYQANFHHVIVIDERRYSKTLKLNCDAVLNVDLQKPVELILTKSTFLSLSQAGLVIFPYDELAADTENDLYGLAFITLIVALLLIYQGTLTFAKRTTINKKL